MDNLYDQQDIYCHYDEIFEMKNLSKEDNKTPIDLRNNNILPFSNLLENFYEEILNEFKDENERDSLSNIRWYNFKEFETKMNNDK